MRSGHDSEINRPVGLGVGQALDLGNIEIRVDLGTLVVSSSIVYQDACTRLVLVSSPRVPSTEIASAHGVDKDWGDPCLFESGFEAPKNGFGPLKVISISLYTQNASRWSSTLRTIHEDSRSGKQYRTRRRASPIQEDRQGNQEPS